MTNRARWSGDVIMFKCGLEQLEKGASLPHGFYQMME